jgi:predicted RNase H-like nuclease (RuvC/YqgF family)
MKKFSHIKSSVVCNMIDVPGMPCDNPNCLYAHPTKTVSSTKQVCSKSNNNSDSPKQSKTDIDTLEAKITRLENRNTKLKEENSGLKEENAELKEKVDSMTKKLAKICKLGEI